MDKDIQDAIANSTLLWSFGIAAFAGFISYLQRFAGDNPVKWSWLVASTKVLTAGFVGLLTNWLLSGWNLPERFVDFSLGVAGYGGAETIAFFQSVFQDSIRRAAGAGKDSDAKG